MFAIKKGHSTWEKEVGFLPDFPPSVHNIAGFGYSYTVGQRQIVYVAAAAAAAAQKFSLLLRS